MPWGAPPSFFEGGNRGLVLPSWGHSMLCPAKILGDAASIRLGCAKKQKLPEDLPPGASAEERETCSARIRP